MAVTFGPINVIAVIAPITRRPHTKPHSRVSVPFSSRTKRPTMLAKFFIATSSLRGKDQPFPDTRRRADPPAQRHSSRGDTPPPNAFFHPIQPRANERFRTEARALYSTRRRSTASGLSRNLVIQIVP